MTSKHSFNLHKFVSMLIALLKVQGSNTQESGPLVFLRLLQAASLCCLQFWGAMLVCMCMYVLNDIYVYAAYVDVVFHCTVARVTGYKARCECTIVITITYLRTGGVDAYCGIKVLLGGPFAHGHRVALRHLPCIGPHHVEPNHPLLEKKTRPTNQRRS